MYCQAKKILLIAAILATTCCGCTPRANNARIEALKNHIAQPEVPLIDIAHLSLEIGDIYESRKEYQQAEDALKKAIWAFELNEKLTGESDPLVDDARESLKRIKGKKESSEDLSIGS